MAEHTVEEIRGLVDSKIISPEDGLKMIKEADEFYREHITVATGPTVQQQLEERDRQLAELVGAGAGDTRADVPIPAVVNAEAVFGALPPNWQEKMYGMKIAIAAPGEPFAREDDDELDLRNENAATIAVGLDAALDSAMGWLKDVDVTTLPDEVRQAVDLVGAAQLSAGTLLEVLGIEDTEQRDDAENMASVPVKCELCDGKGEVDGKVCPRCDGSGVEAQQRSKDGVADGVPDSAPKGSTKCAECKGSGKINEGHRKCPACKGKGYQTPDDADDVMHRSDASSWSDKPWSDFSAADYTPEQYKRAALVVEGDGSKKSQAHLPVREPNGKINKNGVHAAASRLDSTDLPADLRAEAANKLADLYSTLGEEPPASVKKHTTREEPVDDEALNQQRARMLAKMTRQGVKA